MQFDKEKITFLLRKNWKLICIVFYGRSGSFFLQSILDGHPSIVSLPPFVHNMYQYSLDKDSDVYRKKFLYSELWERFFPMARRAVEDIVTPSMFSDTISSAPSRLYGENRDISFKYDINNLIHIVNNIITELTQNDSYIDRKTIYIAFFLSYNIMIGRDLDELLDAKYLMCQLHTPNKRELQATKEDFEDLFYIVSGREPVSGLISHIQKYNEMRDTNYFTEGAYNWCVPIALQEVLQGAVVYNFLNRAQCRVVKNEYLHLYQEDYVKALLDYLGLSWAEICGKSTINRELFWWQFGEHYKTGFNPAYKWKICDKGHASCRDKQRFSALLKDRYEAWNYTGCPNATFNLETFLKEGFDFFDTLNLSEHIRYSFKKIITEYYQNSYGHKKDYIPILEYAKDTQPPVLNCTFKA